MADVKNEVVKEEFKDSLITIKEFRTKHAEGVSAQAINYAIDNDLIDVMDIGPRVRIIVMTEKTKKYTPNRSDKRETFRSTENL